MDAFVYCVVFCRNKEKYAMKTNKDICAELKRVFCIYEIGDEVSDKHVRLFSKYMDKYINAIKHRPGTTTHIDVVNCPQYILVR